MEFKDIRYQIDRNSPIPLYHQLRQLLMKEILSGALKPGTMLPSEIELCDMLALSRPTVRQALNTMMNEGYLVRKKGKGTFISRPKLEANFIQKLESFHSEMINLGIKPRTQVLRLEISAGMPSCNEHLGIPQGQHLVVLERLCYGDDEPVFYQESYLPAARFASLIYEDLTAHSLYSLLQSKFDTRVTHVHRQIEAVNASQSLADLLLITRGQAICRVENIAYDETGAPVEYNFSSYRGDRNKFTMDMYADASLPHARL